MSEHIFHIQDELAEIISRHTVQDGYYPTDIPCLAFSRYTQFHYSTMIGPPYELRNPSIGIVVQGTKNVVLGSHRFIYGPNNYLVVSMDLPIIIEAVDPSPECPNLSCRIEFDAGMILELLQDHELNTKPNKSGRPSIYVAEMDFAMMDAVVRLVRLLDHPQDVPILAPIYTKEVLYRILQGENGDSLKQVALEDGAAIQIKHTIEYIMQHFRDTLRIEQLAEDAGMSMATLHRHFKQIAAISPIQFQKQLRLQEARRLILSGASDVAEAAFYVGYESHTQFSREYSRMFGLAPREDVRNIKRHSYQK